MAQISLKTPTARDRLEPRYAPYWHVLKKGRSIGFVKGRKESYWRARLQQPDKRLVYTTFHNSNDWDYEQAEDASSEWFGKQIGLPPEALNMTVEGAVDHYKERISIKKKTEKQKKGVAENAARVKKHLSDKLSKTLLSKLTKAQIEAFRDGMIPSFKNKDMSTDDEEALRKAMSSANRVLNIFKAVLNKAYEDELITGTRPWILVKPFEDVDEARKLYLTESQVREFLGVTEGAFKDLCKACILTGNRVGSLTSAQVQDFDKKEGTLRLESRKGNGKIKIWHCVLSNDALNFFKKVTKDKLPKALIFTKDSGEPWGKNGYRRAMLAAAKKSKMPSDFDMYAFRHYHISKALNTAPAIKIARNCGTSTAMIEKHYGKFLNQDMRDAMNLVELGI